MSATVGTDREDYLGACRGERIAFQRLAERYQTYVYRSAAIGLGPERSAAEDVAHKVWLNVCRHIKQVADGEREPLELKHEHSFQSWLKRIITNAVTDEFRRTSRRSSREVEEDDLVDDPDLTEALVRDDDRSQVWRALQQLGEQCRELLLLLIQDPPLDYQTIAGILDRPIGSIGPTRARCLDQLKAAL